MPILRSLASAVGVLLLAVGCSKGPKPTSMSEKPGNTIQVGKQAMTLPSAEAPVAKTGSLDQKQVDKLRMGMTMAQVESILGSGRKTPAGKEWGDGQRSLILIFEDGKVSGWISSGLKMPEQDGPVPDFKRAAIVSGLGSAVLYTVQTNKLTFLPGKLEELTFLKETNPKTYQAVEKGDLVVVWGAPLDSPLIAYEKVALTEGGFAFKMESHRGEKVSAAELKAALAKIKK